MADADSNRVNVSLRLDPAVLAAVDWQCKAEGITRTQLVERACRRETLHVSGGGFRIAGPVKLVRRVVREWLTDDAAVVELTVVPLQRVE